MGIYRAVDTSSVVALASFDQISQETVDTMSRTMSPLHFLTETEISKAATATNKAFGKGTVFNRISPAEPDKIEARAAR